MNTLSRRGLIKASLGAILSPAIGWAVDIQAVPLTAASFASGKLKGFAIGSVESRGGDVGYFDALQATGANLARVFFPFRKCKNCEQWGRSGAHIEALHQILDWCRERGIRLVVVGDFEGSDRPLFWQSNALRRSFVENWKWFAGEFSNDPVIAGLDLLNEPNPPWPSGKVMDAHALWRPLAEQAIAGIREAEVDLPIIYEGIGGGQAIGLRQFVPFSDPQVVYSIHFYTPHAITHQHVSPAWARTIPYPAGAEWGVGDVVAGTGGWDRSRLELSMQDVIAFQRHHKVPIYVGEFSCVRWAPDGSAQRYIADCLALFKKYGWSWSYHEFRGWPGWDAEIASELPLASKRSFDSPVSKLLAAELAGNRH